MAPAHRRFIYIFSRILYTKWAEIQMYFLSENMCFLEIVKISDIFFGRRARFRPEYAPIPDPVFRPPRRPGKTAKTRMVSPPSESPGQRAGSPPASGAIRSPRRRGKQCVSVCKKKDGLNRKTAYAKFFYMISLVFFSYFSISFDKNAINAGHRSRRFHNSENRRIPP